MFRHSADNLGDTTYTVVYFIEATTLWMPKPCVDKILNQLEINSMDRVPSLFLKLVSLSLESSHGVAN